MVRPRLSIPLLLLLGLASGAEPAAARPSARDILERMRAERTERQEAREAIGRPEPARPGEGAEGTPVALPRPPRRRFGSLAVVLDAAPRRLVEDQSSTRPDAYLNIGRRIDTSISFLPGGSVRKQAEESAESLGVFLGTPALRIESFRIRPLSFRWRGDVLAEGETPPVGRLEVLEVREVGDVRGEVVHTVDGISFEIGTWTEVPVEIAADPEKRYLVVLSIPGEEGEEAALTVPASASGSYPALRLDPRTGVPLGDRKSRRFDAAVAFVFQPDPRVVRPSIAVEGEFVEAIRTFLRENPEAAEVPLKLRLE